MEGPLLETIDLIERDILQAAGNNKPDTENLARMTAKVLSGQTVEVGGRWISVYDERYRKYWDEDENNLYGTYKGDGFVKKIATDYYADASMLQVPGSAVKVAFETGSTGTFENLEFVQNFVGYTVKRYTELKEHNPQSAAIFREYMKKRISEGLKLGFTGQAPKHLWKYFWKQGNTEGDPLVASLIFYGFITKEEVFDASKGNQGDEEFRIKIETQLAALNRGEFRLKQSSSPRPTGKPPI